MILEERLLHFLNLYRYKAQTPLTEVIIDEIKNEFITWLENRKFAPTIRALNSSQRKFNS